MNIMFCRVKIITFCLGCDICALFCHEVNLPEGGTAVKEILGSLSSNCLGVFVFAGCMVILKTSVFALTV